MKSIFLSILIFAGVFAVACSGILSVAGKDWFHYAAYFILASVMICGIIVTAYVKRKNVRETDGDKLSSAAEKENTEAKEKQ